MAQFNDRRSVFNYGADSPQADVLEVIEAGPNYTTVRLADGSVETRRGDRASRNNNPGNIRPRGNGALYPGAVGADNTASSKPGRKMQVFANPQAGENGIRFNLFNMRENQTVRQAIRAYAPPSENDTEKYIRVVADAAGVTPDTRMGDLNYEQRNALISAQKRHEGNTGFRRQQIEPAGVRPENYPQGPGQQPMGMSGFFGNPTISGIVAPRLVDAPPSAAPRTTATQSPSAIQQIASWLSNIADRASNERPIPPASVPKMQDRITPEPWGGPIYSSNDPPLSSGMRRTPTGPGTMAAPVSPVTRSPLPNLVRPDEAFGDVNAKRAPSFFYSAENAPKPIDPFSWDIGRGNNLAAAAPRPSSGGFPPLSQPVAGNPRQADNAAGRPGAPSGNTPVSWIPASITQGTAPSGNRTTIDNVSGSGRVPAIGAAMSATQATAGMMGKGILSGLTNMGQKASEVATSWRNVLNPAYTAAQQALARAQAANPGGASTLVPSTGKPGELGTPVARTMGSIAKLQAELDKTPKFIRTAAPATPAPARLPVTVVRTLPQVTPAVTPPSGGGNGNSSGNPFTAAGMQRVGTAPSGAALWSNGNGQVFSGSAPSNLFGGMGFGGGGGSFRGVNNY